MRLGYIKGEFEIEISKQQSLLLDMNVDEIYIDNSPVYSRSNLYKKIAELPEGSVIICDTVNRVASCTKELIELTRRMKERKVRLLSVKENIDTATHFGRAVITMLGALLEIEKQFD